MMKKPGFSTARERPFKLGPAMREVSVMVARSLALPALKESEATPPLLSTSNFPLKVAFIDINLYSRRRQCIRLVDHSLLKKCLLQMLDVSFLKKLSGIWTFHFDFQKLYLNQNKKIKNIC